MENKNIFTALFQGIAGGALGYFLLSVFSALYYPNDYNLLYPFGLPIILFFGSAVGATKSLLMWLAEIFLKTRLNFVARAALGMGFVTPLAAAIYLMSAEGHRNDTWPLSWLIGFVCTTGLPVALMTSSSIDPLRIIVLGTGRRRALPKISSWLEIPAGFLLRAASIFSLLEALMILTIWIYPPRLAWADYREPDYLPGIVLAVIYFAYSTCLSIRSPGKFFLLPAAILINLPATILMVKLRSIGSSGANFLAYTFMGFISLWAVYALARTIALSLPLRLNDILKEIANARDVTPGMDCEARL